MAGAGQHLHDLIAQYTGEEPDFSCGCRAFARKMDANLAWAQSHVDVITKKLVREAKKRAALWRAVPVNDRGTLLNAFVHRRWQGAFSVPGSGMLLRPFVRRMVLDAIGMAEEDGRFTLHND